MSKDNTNKEQHEFVENLKKRQLNWLKMLKKL